ncbi:Uma2 family endonuclease [Fodinicola feengrottensis]|uniref:Uma2 family endonuclease n=1 Tax=Fodinicola feengrottensis TaxID=435914 RepID=A0ABP4UBP4_9ACTN|nr:Uma2 family endonuclease [Fodinicola feengrottensis]
MTAETPGGLGVVTVEQLRRYPDDAHVRIVEDTVYLSRDGGFDVADLEAIEDDGWRHELIDGIIVMSPAPVHAHQRAVVELVFALRTSVPEQLEVLVAPFDVDLGFRRRVQPDVLIVPAVELGQEVPRPVLVIEILSPSNRRHDLVAKRRVYEQAGIASYWIVDPDQPSTTVLELRDDHYFEVGQAAGSAELAVEKPYDITIRPADLVK